MNTEVKAQIIQKAWEDSSFKEKLLSNPKSAIKEFLGITIPGDVQMQAVEEANNNFVLVIPPNPAAVMTAGRAQMYNW